MKDLWIENHPKYFWQFHLDVPFHVWNKAFESSKDVFNFGFDINTINDALSYTLGEKRFGDDPWRLEISKRIYYSIKPYLPTKLRFFIRKQLQNEKIWQKYKYTWPIENRYAHFLWRVAISMLDTLKMDGIFFKPLWPNGKNYCLVLTHDIEGINGYRNIKQLAEVDLQFGFRSAFNFVPELYPIDSSILEWLVKNGFEVGIHGLKHDGKLYATKKKFSYRARRINEYLSSYHAVGFRSPLTHRQPEWMQELDIEYDSSFFDTDPFEPIPGGAMTIWPYFIGKFIELPMTLAQDNTLNILNLNDSEIWLRKVQWIKLFRGMVLVNVHPDYFFDHNINRYCTLLREISKDNDLWHALPCDVARWWRRRHSKAFDKNELDYLSKDALLTTLSASNE